MAAIGNYKAAMEGKDIEELPLIKWNEAAVHVRAVHLYPLCARSSPRALRRLAVASATSLDSYLFWPCKRIGN